jgi:hypothetical protein
VSAASCSKSAGDGAKLLAKPGVARFAGKAGMPGHEIREVLNLASGFDELDDLDALDALDAACDLREPAGHDPTLDGAEVVNAVLDRVRAEMLRRIGSEDLLTPRSASESKPASAAG